MLSERKTFSDKFTLVHLVTLKKKKKGPQLEKSVL